MKARSPYRVYLLTRHKRRNMENKLEKKYGLPMAIAMVVGIVVGSGIFFKAEEILDATGGNLWLSIAAWLIGGAIMIACAYTFAVLATRHEKCNGLVDYTEVMVGKKPAYFVGWFMATIYNPILVAVLSWVSARFMLVLVGAEHLSIISAECFMLAGVIMILLYVLNVIAPKLAGKFQVSSTIIKLVPLLLMAVVGAIVGLVNGTTVDNFGAAVSGDVRANPLFYAVVATSFAYEGWILAVNINSEIKNSKRNLPIALVAGTLAIVAIYLLYFVGIAGAKPISELMGGGQTAVKSAFTKIFSGVMGTGLYVFIVISVLGTTNGLMVANTRNLHSLGIRGMGPSPELMSQVDKKTNMPNNAAAIALGLSALWMIVWFANFAGWFGNNFFDISVLPIVAIYALYIPIFVRMMIKEKDLKWFNRFAAPSAAIAGAVFMIVACAISHKMMALWFLCATVGIMGIGALFLIKRKKAPETKKAAAKK